MNSNTNTIAATVATPVDAEMAAFDKLPAAIREMLNYINISISCVEVLKVYTYYYYYLRGTDALYFILETLANAEKQELASFYDSLGYQYVGTILRSNSGKLY